VRQLHKVVGLFGKIISSLIIIVAESYQTGGQSEHQQNDGENLPEFSLGDGFKNL